jgi:hypothetical protein
MDKATKTTNKQIIAKYANSTEIKNPDRNIKVVFIYEGFEPFAHIAWMEMMDIAQGHGMKICDIIVQPASHSVMDSNSNKRKS